MVLPFIQMSVIFNLGNTCSKRVELLFNLIERSERDGRSILADYPMEHAFRAGSQSTCTATHNKVGADHYGTFDAI
jgi:hypothetical protein